MASRTGPVAVPLRIGRMLTESSAWLSAVFAPTISVQVYKSTRLTGWSATDPAERFVPTRDKQTRGVRPQMSVYGRDRYHWGNGLRDSLQVLDPCETGFLSCPSAPWSQPGCIRCRPWQSACYPSTCSTALTTSPTDQSVSITISP